MILKNHNLVKLGPAHSSKVYLCVFVCMDVRLWHSIPKALCAFVCMDVHSWHSLRCQLLPSALDNLFLLLLATANARLIAWTLGFCLCFPPGQWKHGTCPTLWFLGMLIQVPTCMASVLSTKPQRSIDMSVTEFPNLKELSPVNGGRKAPKSRREGRRGTASGERFTSEGDRPQSLWSKNLLLPSRFLDVSLQTYISSVKLSFYKSTFTKCFHTIFPRETLQYCFFL